MFDSIYHALLCAYFAATDRKEEMKLLEALFAFFHGQLKRATVIQSRIIETYAHTLDEYLNRFDGYTYQPSETETPTLVEFIPPSVDEQIEDLIKHVKPRKYCELTLVHTVVIEKVGRKWKQRKYWRIAGEEIHGRYDYIRCDGPNLQTKKTFVPANYRRSTILLKGGKGKKGDFIDGMKQREGSNVAQSQIKRNKIAGVPIAIRFVAAKKLKARLEDQAQKAFFAGNMARYDALDNRANTVGQWIAHVAAKYGNDLIRAPEEKKPTTDRQQFRHDIKKMPKSYRVKSATDTKLATKLRNERIARLDKWSARNGKRSAGGSTASERKLNKK